MVSVVKGLNTIPSKRSRRSALYYSYTEKDYAAASSLQTM